MPKSAQALDHISIKGFRSIALLEEFKFRPINVLVGANGSGKSNFVAVFSFLRNLREGRLQETVRRAGGASQLAHFGLKRTQEIRFELSFRGGVNGYRVLLKPTDDDSFFVASEEAWFWDRAKGYKRPYLEGVIEVAGGREAGISARGLSSIPGWIQVRLDGFRVYHVHDTSSSSPMRATAKVADNAFLRPDGSNLAAFLFLLQTKHLAEYELIRRTVQRVAPFFDDFVVRPDAINEETIRLAWKHLQSDEYFGVSSLSDGTLRFIVLATLFLQPDDYKPAVIVVDEPELGLHPFAITMLASLVKAAAATTQVVLSTQSALLLDHFEPEHVVVAEQVQGATHLTRLEGERLDAWLGDYGLGQLWEKNEFGGRPRK